MKFPFVGLLGSLVILLFSPTAFSQSQVSTPSSWAEVNQNKKGSIDAYWYESRPFVYQDPRNQVMMGIEFDIIKGFRKYLKDEHGVELTINWKKAESFSGLYETIRDKKQKGSFGVSAFSITDKRKAEVDFSPSYMSDITVLITSSELPVVKNLDEFYAMLPNLTAITIKETTYEQELFRLQTQTQLPFSMRYIHSSENILRTIEKTDSTFGFIDLPVYMLLFKEDPSLSVKRQNLFTIKREGYAFIYPKNSDWNQPINEYFLNERFKSDLEKIITRYIDLDLYQFVEGLAIQSSDQTVSLLTKEKEIQSQDLLNKARQIIEETRKRNFLVAMIGVILIFLVIIIILYRKSQQQKQKIETQRKNIELKSGQLEKRNQHLLALDEEKNNLIKILAHDLRTPINHVQGLAHILLLHNEALPEDQKAIIKQIMDASVRLNKMITHLLDIDALENNRVTVFMDAIHISPLVQQVVISFEKQAQRKDIALAFTTRCESCYIKGDPLFLIQVFENLISNAIKFSGQGTRIEITVQQSNEKVNIRVSDEGPGLTEDDVQNLFKKFQRLSAKPTAGESSLGLGLSIVKKYVELMGGCVRCESEVGKGASFIVEFPNHVK